MGMLDKVRLGGAGLAIAALVAVGCQTTLLLNDDNLESEISSWVLQTAGEPGVVTCPDDRPIQQGDTFQCVVTFGDGSTATLQVTQTDNSGNVTWRAL
jgi:hypothetical protein